MDGDYLARWSALLDEANYYQLLQLGEGASFDQIQAAFQRFAVEFHPDQHRTRSELEREAILAIFRRGSEAYRVLQDSALRARYDEGLRGGTGRMRQSMTPNVLAASIAPSAARPSIGSPRLEDQVRTASIRPFVRRAEELAAQGDVVQAHLQIRLALSREPENTALQQFEQTLQALRKR
jgi:DnaJ-class molecular chaperone